MKPTFKNGVNLGYWLYRVHPELYARILPLATKASAKLGALADDVSSSDTGTTTTFDPAGDTFNISGGSDVLNNLAPDMASIATPELTNISVETSGFTVPDFQTESNPSGIFSAIDSGLKSVGSWLTSAAGLSTVGNIANTVIKANTPQQQTVQTQIARVASGSNPLPITYGANPSGQLVPILQTGLNQGRALTPSTLASFMPSSLRPWATPISIGILALLGIGLMRRRR
jgi:hypothetical protein